MFEAPRMQNFKTQDSALKKATTLKTGQQIFEHYLEHDRKIKEEDFVDIYGAEEIAKDKKAVEKMKLSSNYEKPSSNSVVLENLIADVAEKEKWFGTREFRIVQLSDYDDKMDKGAHMDAVLEIQAEEGEEFVVRIGLDFTTAINADNLLKKRDKCVRAVKNGKLFNVKYFQSKLNAEKGKIENVPAVFVGMDKNSLGTLCEDLGKGKNVIKSQAQFMLLDQMLHQLDTYAAIAETQHGLESEIAAKLDFARFTIAQILQEKESLRPKNFRLEAGNDGVYSYIMKYT